MKQMQAPRDLIEVMYERIDDHSLEASFPEHYLEFRKSADIASKKRNDFAAQFTGDIVLALEAVELDEWVANDKRTKMIYLQGLRDGSVLSQLLLPWEHTAGAEEGEEE